MPPLFAPSSPDLDHLRSTVKALGTATLPGLSAALSWREHKTAKVLAHELARPNTPLVYDPARRTVRWVATMIAPPVEASAPVVVPAARAPAAPSAPAPVYTPSGLKTLCPHCHVALQSTGSSGLVVCPQCGRLSSARGATRDVARVAPTPVIAAAAPSAPIRPAGGGDRRSQEMLAAWLTNQSIPCPKCRTPLRHRGVSEYACPACGQQIRFPVSTEKSSPAPIPAQ
jgi:uncharacterized Zn finger protein (UPF0148 family)